MNGSAKRQCPSRNRSPCWHSLRVSKASTEHTDISSWARLMFADFMLNSGRREKVSFLGVASDPTRPPYPQLLSLRGPSSAALQRRISSPLSVTQLVKLTRRLRSLRGGGRHDQRTRRFPGEALVIVANDPLAGKFDIAYIAAAASETSSLRPSLTRVPERPRWARSIPTPLTP